MAEESDRKVMIGDYMEKGFLENIIDMFKHDKSLFPLIGDLMTDERMRVRLGIASLVESLAKEDPANLLCAISGIAALLRNENPIIRGDAAYLLGIIGHLDAIPFLKDALGDEHADVRAIARESIQEINSKAASGEHERKDADDAQLKASESS
ncbi:MAG: HEAT repeat domain-containing protein [Thermodesulfovibrionales bacterium]